MPSSYTSNLRLVLPVTGELSGTWGDTVNGGLTELVDSAISGTAAITMTAADYTLSTANGATDEARQMVLSLAGTPGASYNVIVPAVSKLYLVKNATGFAQTVKTSGGSGISVPTGVSVFLYCDGTNVVTAAGDVTRTGTQTLTNKTIDLTNNTLIATSLQLKTAVTDETGSGALVFATSPTLVTPLLGTPTSGTLTNCTGLPAAGVTGTALTAAASVTVAQGGTGRATSTTAYGLLAAGTTATGAHQTLAAGATTEVLVGGGASALPVWTTATGSGAPVRATSPTLVTPVLGTPASGTLTNCTGLPAAGVVGTAATLGANTFTGDQTLGNNDILTIKTATFNSQTTIATTSGAITLDWNTAQNQFQTEPTGTITYTFTAPPGPCHLQLIINSDGTSTAQTINWPGTVVQYGTIWAGANNKKAVINFWYDGSSYHMIGTNQV